MTMCRLFSEWEMLQAKFVDKIKTHILCSITFFFYFYPPPPRKSRLLWDMVEKCGRDRETRDDNIIRRTRFACRIIKAIDTHSEYLILVALVLQQWLLESAWFLCVYTRGVSSYNSFFTMYRKLHTNYNQRSTHFSYSAHALCFLAPTFFDLSNFRETTLNIT